MSRASKYSLSLRLSISLWACLLVVAMLAPFLANHKPILVSTENELLWFPHSTEINQAKNINWELKPLINYGESSLDLQVNNPLPPFQGSKHILGTDYLGRDMLVQLIYGTRTALCVGFGAILLALIIGLTVGGLSAYLGDDNSKISVAKLAVLSPILLFGLISIIVIPPYGIKQSDANVGFLLSVILLSTILALWLCNWIIDKGLRKYSRKKLIIPLDLLLNRFIEIIDSLPALLLIIAFRAFFEGGMLTLILIIGLFSWTNVAKYFRAEILSIREQQYIESAKALGIKNLQLVFKHILPNAIQPIIVLASFGIASVILLEASLSFLGIGLGADQASWGSMIANARFNLDAWWLALFPGLLILLSLLSIQQIGSYLGNTKR